MQIGRWVFGRRAVRDIGRLTAFPPEVFPGSWVMIFDALERSAQAFGAPRALLLWDEEEEPWIHLACFDNGRFNWTRESPAELADVVDSTLGSASFYSRDASDRAPTVVYRADGKVQKVRKAVLKPDFRSRFEIRSVLSAAIAGSTWKGRLLVLDVEDLAEDDLVNAEVAASLIVNRMDRFALRDTLNQAAITEERVRLARDLHDGLLQSFTGIALQLQALQRLIHADPEVAVQNVREIEQGIEKEQRNLRRFIRRLRPATSMHSGSLFDLTALLHELQYRIKKQWGLKVELQLDFREEAIPPPLRLEIQHLVHEAVVNAAKHAEATVVFVELISQDASVRIAVRDNGRGFPFVGRFDRTALEEMKQGPRSIKERVASLGGELIPGVE